MRIERRTLPGRVQSRYYEHSGIIVIDPSKVPQEDEGDFIAQSLLYAVGREDLAPYARRAALERHLHAVPDRVVSSRDGVPECVDGVG